VIISLCIRDRYWHCRIGALIARGDVATYGLSEEDLIIRSGGIDVGSQHYPLNQVANLDFDVQAYAGMYVNDGAMISGSNSDGMTNRLSFEAGGKTIACGFFLESPGHVQQLGLLFNEFYERHIPFVEHNRSTRTYMFQVLSEKEWWSLKTPVWLYLNRLRFMGFSLIICIWRLCNSGSS